MFQPMHVCVKLLEVSIQETYFSTAMQITRQTLTSQLLGIGIYPQKSLKEIELSNRKTCQVVADPEGSH